MTERPTWIAVDWGTSNLRAWGMREDGAVLFERQSAEGMNRLTPADYPSVLMRLLADTPASDMQDLDVVVCGMAGARQGWREAPYLEAPAALDTLAQQAAVPPTGDTTFKPRILPGVCQKLAGAEDVMRGEETQILGLTALKPGFAGTVCMPGTHAKWVAVDSGRIERFETVMTGELFDLLRHHSVLRHSMPEEASGEDASAGIADGLALGLAEPDRLTGLLFRTRAAALLSGKSTDWCFGFMSGLLVGAEIGGHKSWFNDGDTIPLIGSASLCGLYAEALKQGGVQTEIIDAGSAVRAGLSAARKQFV